MLASGSPRRARLLQKLGLSFEVIVSEVDEALLPGELGAKAALRLARAKAAAVAPRTSLPVLAADTVVLLDGEVLGKPVDAQDARRMLGQLQGRRHEVVTGVCLTQAGREAAAIERTSVAFGALSDRQIEWYVATGEPMDKAGAYHVDGLGALLLTGVFGSPSNVAGLPVELLYRLAHELGLNWGWPPR